MTHRTPLAACLAVALLASISTGAKVRPARHSVVITGTIDHFIDGDTYWLTRNDGSKVKLREWIEDAPEVAHNKSETDQPGGQEALKYASEHWTGKHVSATVKGKSYDRLVVQTVADGETQAVGLVMVASGNAQVYPQSTPRPPQAYKDAEAAAVLNKRGIYKDTPSPVAPWVWRKQSRKEN